jgi:flagellar L-ring protein precursor FlgH
MSRLSAVLAGLAAGLGLILAGGAAGAGERAASRDEARAAERMAGRTGAPSGEDSRWGRRNPISDRQLRTHDLVTIVILENSSTSTSLETDYEKKTELQLDVAKAFNLKAEGGGLAYEPLTAGSKRPNLDIAHSRKLEGKGELAHKEKFDARVTAEVIEILPNGDLMLEARKRVSMNEDHSELILTGRVRPQDVRSDNTVQSDRVADSHIQYRPKGAAADANKRGWLHRLFDYVNIF